MDIESIIIELKKKLMVIRFNPRKKGKNNATDITISSKIDKKFLIILKNTLRLRKQYVLQLAIKQQLFHLQPHMEE